MEFIEVKTLVDITDTKVNRPRPGAQLEHDQCRNFITFKQCLELRSNIMFESAPRVETVDVKDLGFGSKYKGKHQVWTFRFSPERSGAYVEGVDALGALIEDLHSVPIIKNLKESINIEKAIFDLKDSATKNTIVKAISGII